VDDKQNPWTLALQKKSFAVQLILVSVSILIVISLLPYFFHSVIGPKPGAIINDFLLNAFTPQDHSWIIFGLIYISLVTTLQGIYRKPEMVLLGLKCYLILTVLRMITMYAFTLEAPEGIIPLHDPLVDVIAYGGNVFNKDLFFSGHVATLTLFVLVEERLLLKRILIVNTVLVAGLILLQRVHYTVDVVVAPLVILGLFHLVKKYFNTPLTNGT
jgi:hypothetical protein